MRFLSKSRAWYETTLKRTQIVKQFIKISTLMRMTLFCQRDLINIGLKYHLNV